MVRKEKEKTSVSGAKRTWDAALQAPVSVQSMGMILLRVFQYLRVLPVSQYLRVLLVSQYLSRPVPQYRS